MTVGASHPTACEILHFPIPLQTGVIYYPPDVQYCTSAVVHHGAKVTFYTQAHPRPDTTNLRAPGAEGDGFPGRSIRASLSTLCRRGGAFEEPSVSSVLSPRCPCCLSILPLLS